MALLTGALAHADVVADWNNATLDAIRIDNTTSPIASRSLAILHAAIYDTVNAGEAAVSRIYRYSLSISK